MALHIKCDNVEKGCEWRGTVGTLMDHLENCDYVEVSCKYESIGCNELVMRKDLQAHEQDDSHHLHKALEAIALLKEKNDTFEIGEQFVFKLTNFEIKKANSEIFYSQPFYTSLGGYRLEVQVYPNGNHVGKDTHVSIYAHILRGQYNHNLVWPFSGAVSCTLLNQLADDKHITKELIGPADAIDSNLNSALLGDGEGLGINTFIPHEELLENKAADTQYLKDDTLYFRVTVEESSHKPWLKCTAK